MKKGMLVGTSGRHLRKKLTARGMHALCNLESFFTSKFSQQRHLKSELQEE